MRDRSRPDSQQTSWGQRSPYRCSSSGTTQKIQEGLTPAQLDRERGDEENPLDELTNLSGRERDSPEQSRLKNRLLTILRVRLDC